MADLTTEFAAYIRTLKAAAPTAPDVSTLVAKDLTVVRAAHPLPTEVDDLNTLYEIHLA
jgi:hypothetical protein